MGSLSFKNDGARLLWEVMTERNLTQVDVSAMLRGRSGPLSDGAMSRWLHGDMRPSLSLALQLEELFGIPVQAWHQPAKVGALAPAKSSRRAPLIVRRRAPAKRARRTSRRTVAAPKEAR